MARPSVLALYRKGQALSVSSRSVPFESHARGPCLKPSNTYTNNEHVCFLPLFVLLLIMTDTLYSKPSEGQQYPNMPELPAEIWTMIAKHVKRDPPPAGEPGNWNDHFHQQDLTSLMRVNHVSLVQTSIVYPRPCHAHASSRCPIERRAQQGLKQGGRRVSEESLIDV